MCNRVTGVRTLQCHHSRSHLDRGVTPPHDRFLVDPLPLSRPPPQRNAISLESGRAPLPFHFPITVIIPNRRALERKRDTMDNGNPLIRNGSRRSLSLVENKWDSFFFLLLFFSLFRFYWNRRSESSALSHQSFVLCNNDTDLRKGRPPTNHFLKYLNIVRRCAQSVKWMMRINRAKHRGLMRG